MQRGAFLLFALALAVAAGLGLAVMLLQLALGAADREANLARLATMGLGDGQRTRLVLLEVLPAVVAAAVAAVAAALVLPRIVAPVDQPVGLHRLQRSRAARARRGVGRAADRRADRAGRCDADNRDTGTARRRVDPTRR